MRPRALRLWPCALWCAAALSACSEESAPIGVRSWGPFEVAVELRPSPPRPGHNEVVVLVAGEHRRPVYDAIVSVRARADAAWVQAIEDGHLGVYRRAVDFGRGGDLVLQVGLRRDGEAEPHVVDFPVHIEP